MSDQHDEFEKEPSMTTEEHGTLLTNATHDQRPYYEEAIKRYKGPAKIEIRDEAYYGPGQLYPECFAVHVMNNPEWGKHDLTPFWDIFSQVRVEHG